MGVKPINIQSPDGSNSIGASSLQTDLTVTSSVSGWATLRAVGVAYSDSAGKWRLRFNIAGTVSSGTRTICPITISGVTFKNTANFLQTVCQSNNGSYAAQISGDAQPGGGVINLIHPSETITSYRCSGDVELESKPTWA